MKNIFIYSIISLLFLLIPGIFTKVTAQSFDKAAFYKVMENGKIEDVEKQVTIIAATSNINKDAYTGAMLMKKAGLVKGPSKKLNVFKEGHNKLEAVIKAEPGNIEWYFLRLIIQEHAPKILGYNNEIKKDAEVVHGNFKKLAPEVQAAVMDYRPQSDALQKLKF